MKRRFAFLFLSLVAMARGKGISFTPAEGRVTYRELQFENEQTRVWKTTIMPHSPLKMHRHESPRIVVGLQGGTLKKITERGDVSFLSFETNKAIWLDADPAGELHADVNESSDPIVVMVIELKNVSPTNP